MAEIDEDDELSSLESSHSSLLKSRVQVELESLNAAAEAVNNLENELQAAQTKYIQDRQSYISKLEILHRKIGSKYVMQAQKYFELFHKSQKVHVELRRLAEKFQRACVSCDRSRISLRQMELDVSGKCDSDKLEALNRASEEFSKAEHEKTRCQSEHQSKAVEYAAMQQLLGFLSKDISKVISRAKPFYDLKEQLENLLQVLWQSAEDLALALKCSKQRYQMALDSLESISDEVHERRRQLLSKLPPRTPGVGAEATDDELASWPSTSIDVYSTSPSNKILPALDPSSRPEVDGLSANLRSLDVANSACSSVEQMISIHRDNSADGAEDCSVVDLSESEPAPAGAATAPAMDPALSKAQLEIAPQCRSVSVSALRSGVYVTKSILVDQSASDRKGHDLVQRQFPLLDNLKDAPRLGGHRHN